MNISGPNRRFRRGNRSALITAAVFAAVIAVNLAVHRLPTSFLRQDLSAAGLFDLTPPTQQLLADLREDITITMYYEPAFLDSRIRTVIQRYADASPYIHPELVNLTERPNAGENRTVVVSSAQRSRTIPFDDIVVIDAWEYYTYGERVETGFDGEGQLTGAIEYVTGGTEQRIYVTQGHTETELSDSLLAMLSKANYQVEPVNLLRDGMPPECQALLLNEPQTDLAQSEYELLTQYLQNGGAVVLLAADHLPQQPRLRALMEACGVRVSENYVAELERYYQESYFEFFPLLSRSHPITADIDGNTLALVTQAFGMVITPREGVETVSFMDTTDRAVSMMDGAQRNGPYSIAAEARFSGGGRAIVCTAPTLIYAQITDAFSNAANLSIFMNALGQLLGESGTAIPIRSLKVTYNTTTASGAVSLSAVLVLPLVILLGGFAYWYRRRNM